MTKKNPPLCTKKNLWEGGRGSQWPESNKKRNLGEKTGL